MSNSRRQLLSTFAGAAAVMLVRPILAFSQNGPKPAPMPSPNAPNPYSPAGLERPPQENPNDHKKQQLDRQNQQQIRDQVHQLFDMATELKSKVDATNANTTFDISIVKQAQAIEKLAKQIKSLAKG